MDVPIIRSIQPKDNPAIASIIRSVLEDFKVPKVGTAYADVALDCMFETYQKPRAAYFVLEEADTLIGGGGIAQLDHYKGNVCELQKMYFLEEARGRGLGTQMIDVCLKRAKELGFEKCYLETMSYMEAAQKLYKKYGFQYLNGPMGDTGHHACGVHMILDL
ncbi:MAG: GNAT family N-acetyltransferase [Flavobacteriaceae bacterium]